MASFEPLPIIDHVYTNGIDTVKVISFDGTKAKVVFLDASGKETERTKGFLAYPWKQALFKEKVEPPSSKDEYTFVFDDESKSILVRDRKGREVAKLPGFYGKEGKTFYDVWIEKEKPENQSWEEFKKFWIGNKGETGEEGSTPYIKNGYWYIDGKDTGVKAEGQDGRNGDNGESAFDLWKRKYNSPNASESDFIQSLSGTPGKDGDSAFEIWCKKQPSGKTYTESDFLKWIADQVETQEGAYYIPEMSDDGIQIFFKNSKTGDRVGPYPIKGKDGKTFEPHLDGTNLYFTDESGKPVGPKQNLKGRTFKPEWKKDKLVFTAEDGETIEIDATQLQGKDAFELWKEKHNKPDAKWEDYEEYFKGQNVHTDYNYEDIKDAEIPIQKIARNLITDSDLTDGLQSEEYYHYRQQRIEAIREEGRAMRGNWFQEIFWWCAGADTSVLRTCSADHSKYVGIGTVIFFTALMAFFSCFIAMKLVFGKYAEGQMPVGIVTAIPLGILALVVFFHYGLQREIIKTTVFERIDEDRDSVKSDGQKGNQEAKYKERKTTRKPITKVKWGAMAITFLIIASAVLLYFGVDNPIYKANGIALIVAMFWAAMIFFLDRFITNTMYSDGKTTVSWLEFRSALPRILISIFLGIVISAPLELEIFDSEIEEYIVEKKLETDKAYLSAVQQYDDDKNRISDAITSFVQNNEPRRDDSLYNCKIVGQRDAIIKNKDRVEAGRSESGHRWKDKVDGGQSKTQINVLGFDEELFTSHYNEYLDRLDKYKKKKFKELSESGDTIQKKKEERLKELRDEYKKVKGGSGLYERLAAMHNVAMKKGKPDGYKPLFAKVEEVTRNDSLPENLIGDKVQESANLLLVQQQGLDTIAHQKDSMSNIARIDSTKSVATASSEENIGRDNDLQMTENCWRWLIFLACSIFLACLVAASIVSRKTKKPERWKLFWLQSMPIILVISALIALTVEILYYILWYITTPIGLIMLLFILIDVSPVFYKMMLADGKYDKILHQDKLLEQDLIRLQVAKSLHKINESELSNLSPFIFGSTYDKVKEMLEKKIEYEKDEKGNIKVNKNGNPIVKKAFDFYEPGGRRSDVAAKNKKLFEEVLDMKYRIAWASYAAWYRDMRDHILGKKDDERGKKINPENIDKHEPGSGTGKE